MRMMRSPTPERLGLFATCCGILRNDLQVGSKTGELGSFRDIPYPNHTGEYQVDVEIVSVVAV
jgi:hypothetical protein